MAPVAPPLPTHMRRSVQIVDDNDAQKHQMHLRVTVTT